VLKMTLKKEPFEATKSAEKLQELRQDSDWIRARLYCTRLDEVREYDYIEYYKCHAYTRKCPMIRLEYGQTFWCADDVSLGPYSNGFQITIEGGCWVVGHGKLVYERYIPK
jgi:hypothetical protein